MSQLKIPSEVKKKVDRELDPEEEIKWIDQPIPQFLTVPALAYFLFSILIIGFAIFWIRGTWDDSQQLETFDYIFSLFSLIPMAIGIAISSFPFWEWRRSHHTVYLITNQRAIVIEGGTPVSMFRLPYMIIGTNIYQDNGAQTIKSFSPEELSNVYRRDKKNGLGDVIFQLQEKTTSKGTVNYEKGFFGVRNPKQVEEIIKELAENTS